MSVLLKKVLWYPIEDSEQKTYYNPINITGALDLSVKRGIDIKNNIITLRLKNHAVKFDSSYNIINKYIDDNFIIKFKEDDQIKVYLYYTDDMADVESSNWSNEPEYVSSVPSNYYLRGIYYVTEFTVENDEKGSYVRLKCADKCYILFNKLMAKAFTLTDAINAPEMIQKVSRFQSENQKGEYQGDGNESGVFYDIDAKLFSSNVKSSGTTTSATTNKLIDTSATFETDGVAISDWVKNTTDDVYAYVNTVDSQTQLTLNKDIMGSGDAYSVSDGFIQDVRTATCADGKTTNADTTFPDIAMAKVWKPIYEWFSEISQIDYTNTGDELSGVSTLVYGKPFLYFVDELNRVHWFESSESIDETITIGTTTGIYKYKLDKKVFDIVNFIIFRGGEDLYGNGTLGYELDQNAGTRNLKMRVIPMVDIAKSLIQKEIANGNLVENAAGAFFFSGKNYDRSGAVTPHWSTTEYNDDDDYNDALRDRISEVAKARARKYIKRLAHARYKGTIERKGAGYAVGNLIKITNSNTGQNQELLRVMDVSDKITKNGWITTLSIEQDKEAIVSLG